MTDEEKSVDQLFGEAIVLELNRGKFTLEDIEALAEKDDNGDPITTGWTLNGPVPASVTVAPRSEFDPPPDAA